MSKYKFTIIYITLIAVPFLLHALINLHIYIFTNIPPSGKAWDAFFAGAILGVIGGFIYIAEEFSHDK